MNVPRYLYSQNVKNDFLQFLKDANDYKSEVYCDFKKYEEMISLFPLQSEIKGDLKNFMKNANICIDITQSDDETNHISETSLSKDHNLDEVNHAVLSNSLENVEETNIDDIIDSIKDNLSIQNEVSSILIQDVFKLDNNNLDQVFSSLAGQLSSEEVGHFWSYLMSSYNHTNNEHVILSFVKFVFLPRAKQEFTYELEAMFSSISQKYGTIVKAELVKVLLEMEENRVLQQFIGNLKNDFKTDVLRHFIYTCEKLYPNYISVIESLLNPHCDYDILSKLIDVMSNAVIEFSNDNTYGRLLFNVVNLLERNVCRLEQPIKHILGIHRSIWKIKVQKAVITWFDDSLTQSFV